MFFFFIFSFIQFAHAQDGDVTIVSIGKAELAKDRIGLFIVHATDLNATQKVHADKVFNIVKNDIAFYKYHYDMVTDNLPSIALDYDQWSTKQFRYVIYLSAQSAVGIYPKINYQIHDVAQKKIIEQDSIQMINFSRGFAHSISSALYKGFSGKDGIFSTRVLFVSDVLSTPNKTRKELYIMDFDGEGVERLTDHNSIVISPAFSPDNKSVLYSVITMKNKIQNVDLFIMDLATKKNKVISSKPGINSGAIFSNSGDSIYLTLSYSGDSEIYEMRLSSGDLRKVTNHFADDVDPSISSDGQLMGFLSTRPGPAMIYTLDPRGQEKDVKRISFVGKFNATPRFNPQGTEMAFVSWVDNRFDVYRISRDGTQLVRLTKNFGSNEEPSYSKDGQFLVFTSQRVLSKTKAIQNLYIMTRDGEILGSITNQFGNCLTPRWSN
jgi:TolB protein